MFECYEMTAIQLQRSAADRQSRRTTDAYRNIIVLPHEVIKSPNLMFKYYNHASRS